MLTAAVVRPSARSYRDCRMRLRPAARFVSATHQLRERVSPDSIRRRLEILDFRHGSRSSGGSVGSARLSSESSRPRALPSKSITPGRERIFTYESNAVGNREPALARRRL